ncbi:MAG: bifunctional folylpolyglutamate synthase/dihydrofolate synthase [Candidatus Eiseniibacteriota bacterium]|nr:MAG: bifunctional folylpolyglutamate synthase/dihydrofolate synthase [Candidatus Eisenbacteria bacterium]
MRRAKYEQLLRRFYSLQKRGMRLDLEGTRAILRKVGWPHRSIASALVGGTNGKGSTSAMIASILKAAGHRVGLLTSPHLLDFRERIRVSGECVPKEEVYELLQFLVPAAENDGHSFFETMTALAFRHFRDRDVDFIVAEVGLGGRLDSTNVLNPRVSVITGIAIEHSHILGRTLRSIATEKAGIMRKGRPVVTAATGPGLDRLEEVSAALGARLLRVGQDLRLRSRLLSRAGTVFTSYHRDGRARESPRDLFLGLRGRFQVRNAGCAILACRGLSDGGFPVSSDAVEAGLRDAQWPGRLEEWGREPVFLFDVAHNPQAAAQLVEALDTIYASREVIVVVGMVAEKDHRAFLRRLTRRAKYVVFTQAKCPRAISAHELSERAPSGFSRRSVEDSVSGAVEKALSLARNDELVCVTGSFYTVGEAMGHLGLRVRERI